MSKQMHRTPENLLMHRNGHGYRFKIFRKVRNLNPSTSAFGRAEDLRLEPISYLNGFRVCSLSNPNEDLSKRLSERGLNYVLKWECGARVEGPDYHTEFHVYSDEQKMHVMERNGPDSVLNLSWKMYHIDASSFSFSKYLSNFVQHRLVQLDALRRLDELTFNDPVNG